jgi:hypothetical protein
MVRAAETLLVRRAGEVERRRLRLLAAEGTTFEEELAQDLPAEDAVRARAGWHRPVSQAAARKDIFGLDLDEFVPRSDRKPRGWLTAVSQAKEVAVDEMRALLELHYDDVHVAEFWAKRDGRTNLNRRPPQRSSEYALFRSCQSVFRNALNERLALPAAVKECLRCPQHELDWERLEMVRRAIVEIFLGSGELDLSCEEGRREDLAAALLAAAQPLEVGAAPSFKQQVLPVGSRVVLDLPSETSFLPVDERRALVASVVSKARSVKFQLRPLASALQPPLSKEALALVSSCGVSLRERAEHAGMTVEEAFDELLLHLWDARKRG